MELDFKIAGLKELEAKLNRIDAKLAAKTVKKALRKAGTPTLRQMRAKAPVGSIDHKTYKGRRVAPGFLKRSIRQVVAKNRNGNGYSLVMGVKREAYYGIQYIDVNVTPSSAITKRTFSKKRGGARPIKPYTLRETPWFARVFDANAQQMISAFAAHLRDELKGV